MKEEVSGPFGVADRAAMYSLVQHPGFAVLMAKWRQLREEAIGRLVQLDLSPEKNGALKGEIALLDKMLGWPKGLEKQIHSSEDLQ